MAKRIEEKFRAVQQENKITLKESKEGNDNSTGDNVDTFDVLSLLHNNEFKSMFMV